MIAMTTAIEAVSRLLSDRVWDSTIATARPPVATTSERRSDGIAGRRRAATTAVRSGSGRRLTRTANSSSIGMPCCSVISIDWWSSSPSCDA